MQPENYNQRSTYLGQNLHVCQQYLTEQTDGSQIARLHDVSDEYVLSYVASFAGQARIEEPPELADKLKQQINSALEQYE